MGFLDRAKEVALRAREQGQQRIEDIQARRQAENLLREIGLASYDEHRGESGHEPVVRALAALDAHLRQHPVDLSAAGLRGYVRSASGTEPDPWAGPTGGEPAESGEPPADPPAGAAEEPPAEESRAEESRAETAGHATAGQAQEPFTEPEAPSEDGAEAPAEPAGTPPAPEPGGEPAPEPGAEPAAKKVAAKKTAAKKAAPAKKTAAQKTAAKKTAAKKAAPEPPPEPPPGVSGPTDPPPEPGRD